MKQCPESLRLQCEKLEGHDPPHYNALDGEFTLQHMVPPGYSFDEFRRVKETQFVGYNDTEPHYVGVTFIAELGDQTYVTKFAWSEKDAFDQFMGAMAKMGNHIWGDPS